MRNSVVRISGKWKNRKFMFITAFVIAFSLCMAGWMETEKKVDASAIGTVSGIKGKVLKVRTGAGNGYKVVTSGGTGVTISNGMQVTITGKYGNWYHIKFRQNANDVTGYVASKYIKVRTGRVKTTIYGRTNKQVKVLKTAGASGTVLQVGKKEVSLKTDKKVRVLAETMQNSKKWYQISVTFSKVKCTGYILSDSVNLIFDSKGFAGVVKASKKVTTYEDIATKKIAYQGKKKITLRNDQEVTILDDMVIAEKKYLQVQFTFNGKSVKALVPDSKVFLEIVDNEKSASSTAAETVKASVTKVPSPSPSSKANMTDAEFEASLKKDGFPDSYVPYLMKLHKDYPDWDFVPFLTKLDWNTVIENESKVGLNLLSNSKSYEWKSTAEGAYNWSTDTFIPFDGSTWVTASEKAVKYYMDPRNFLDDRGIFQFESLEYQKGVHTQEGVETILKNTPMSQASYTYQTDAGQSVTELYAKTFMTAAEESGVSPYHLAARVKQEVVMSSTLMSSSVSGKVSGYAGIYNFYNIGASNSTTGNAIANGLKWASTGTTYLRPWTSPYRSIVGGAIYIGKTYINVGQNTIYLEKFNVTSKNRYSHQYMGNIEAPNSEATKARDAYGDEKASLPLVFSIPVYENMPSEACEVPSGGKNPNNYLKTLSVSGYSFATKFAAGDDGSKTYTCSVPSTVDSITINADAAAKTSTVSGDGKQSISDIQSKGSKTFTVKVTAENGDVRNYKITVTKK